MSSSISRYVRRQCFLALIAASVAGISAACGFLTLMALEWRYAAVSVVSAICWSVIAMDSQIDIWRAYKAEIEKTDDFVAALATGEAAGDSGAPAANIPHGGDIS